MEKYYCLPKFVFRIPALHNRAYLEEEHLNSPLFSEALWISSSSFKKLVEANSSQTFTSLPTKIKLTLYKYLTRMSCKTTPMGCFAAIGAGLISNHTSFYLKTNDFFSRTSINFSFFISFLNSLSAIPTFRYKQKYFVNSSLFEFGTSYRYNERHSSNTFKLIEIDAEDYIKAIIEACSKGMTGCQIASLLQSNYDVPQEEALQFVDTLVNNQIIVSELFPSLTKDNYLDFLISRLESYNIPELINPLQDLHSIRTKLLRINASRFGEREFLLKSLDDQLRKNEDSFSEQHMNTNLYISNGSVSLEKAVTDQIKKGLLFLIKLNSGFEQKDWALEEFKSKFKKRYENQKIPLLEALDPDIGIGYAHFNTQSIHTNEIIKDFDVTIATRDVLRDTTSTNPMLQKKYYSFLKNPSLDSIDLTDDDAPSSSESKWANLPLSFTVGTEIFQLGEAPLIYLKFAGGSSAVNTINRFTMDNPDLHKISRTIIEYEEAFLDNDTIFADVSYLPEYVNTSVILSRPSFYSFEIPYMNNSSKKDSSIIQLTDITISLNKQNEVILESAKLHKRIIPRNTTAHDYVYRTNPLYYFLSSIQNSYTVKTRFKFNWGNFSPHEGIFPRVTYNKNIILSLKRWIIQQRELVNEAPFASNVAKIIKERNVPTKVLLKKGVDSTILIDFSIDRSIDILKSEIRGAQFIVLEEYLFDNNTPLIKSDIGFYNNEVFLFFLKQKKLSH